MLPSVFEGIKTDISRFIDVTVIYLRFETYFRRTEGICWWKVDIESKDASFVSIKFVSDECGGRENGTAIHEDHLWLLANS